MKNLTYKAVENSKNTGGESGNYPRGSRSTASVTGQLTEELITQLMQIAQGWGCNVFQHHLYMDTDAQMQSYYSDYAANYNLRNLEDETKLWCSKIHEYGMKVLHRGSWSGIKPNNDFPGWAYGGANFLPLGTVAGAATEGETTYCGKMWRYMDVNVGRENIEDGDIFAPISEFTEFLSGQKVYWFDRSGGDQAGVLNFFYTMKDVVDAYGAYIGKSLKFLSISNYSEYRSGYLGQDLPNDSGFIAIDYYGARTNILVGTPTFTLAAPGTVNMPNHGLQAGDTVKFSVSGGSLPSGIGSGSPYWVSSSGLTRDKFQISEPRYVATTGLEPTPKTLGGTPSGTITLNKVLYPEEPADYVSDWIAVRTATNSGKPLYQTELGGIWGDSWPPPFLNTSTGSRRINTYEDDALYQIQKYRAYRDSLINTGLMNGVSQWGMWADQNTSVVKFVNGAYMPNVYGQIYAAFIKGDGMARIPVPMTDIVRDDWGSRNIHY